jgi:D-threo-aldose 1-dehydrogenase
VNLPPVVFGTSCLGNLYQELPWETKLGILREIFIHSPEPVVLDSAGKYGAGLALESIGKGLRELGAPVGKVVISNKLGWLRTPLRGPEATFEPGVWAALEHDAEQRLGYEGILRCYAQGCELLGEPYAPQLVSVHDPDEYLAKSASPDDRRRRLDDIRKAYRALDDLKRQGKVAAVGVGAKDWTVIREIAEETDLDWVMLALSLTVMSHPPELLAFVGELERRGIGIINSAVFHAGFLTGGAFFDYRRVDPQDPKDRGLFEWRGKFHDVCAKHAVAPAAACVQFGMSVPGVRSTALNTGKIAHVKANVALVRAHVPPAFWVAMKDEGLIDRAYPYLG